MCWAHQTYGGEMTASQFLRSLNGWRRPLMGVLVSGGLVSGLLRAQNGAGAEAGKLLEQLKSLEETVTKARTGNNLAAVDEIREAAGAEAKAVALWIESVRETEFRDKDKKESDFRAWREGPGRRSRGGSGSSGA